MRRSESWVMAWHVSTSIDITESDGIDYRGCPEIGREALISVRPLLENSTVCQKSMPINPVRAIGGRAIRFCSPILGGIPLVYGRQ